MDQRVVDFIHALRAQGVRISLAESIDAMRCVEVAGVADKHVFRSALRASLVKEPRDLPTFDELFPRFFGLETPPPLQQPGSGMSPEERENMAQLVQRLRGMDLKKHPSVSETIDWARALLELNIRHLDRATIENTLNVLLKFEGDLQRARRAMVRDEGDRARRERDELGRPRRDDESGRFRGN